MVKGVNREHGRVPPASGKFKAPKEPRSGADCLTAVSSAVHLFKLKWPSLKAHDGAGVSFSADGGETPPLQGRSVKRGGNQ